MKQLPPTDWTDGDCELQYPVISILLKEAFESIITVHKPGGDIDVRVRTFIFIGTTFQIFLTPFFAQMKELI